MIITDNTIMDLHALATRIETAKRPTRILDGLAWKILVEKRGDDWVRDGSLWMRRDRKDSIAFDMPPPLTADVNRVETILDKALDIWGYEIHREVGRTHARRIEYKALCRSPYENCWGHASSVAIALLAAGLRLKAAHIGRGFPGAKSPVR